MRRLLLIAVSLLLLPAGAEAATRYASPTGSGTACTVEATPCSLTDALVGASAEDTIVVGDGTYDTPLTAYGDGAKPLTIRGATTGPQRPIVRGRTFRLTAASTVSDLTIDTDLVALDIAAAATVDRVKATSARFDGCRVAGGATLRNTVCRSDRGDSASGLATQETVIAADAGKAIALDHVTAYGRFGMFVNADSPLVATSSTFVGLGSEDVYSLDSPGPTLRLSTFDDLRGQASIAGQQPGEPVFVDAAIGDLRQAETSPTIDRGASAATTELDLGGNARRIGAATDTGAYERVGVPPSATITNSPVTVSVDRATVRGFVDANGGYTTWQFRYGTSSLDRATSVRGMLGTAADPRVSDVIEGLTPGTTYRYALLAMSEAGTAQSFQGTFQTVAAVPTATTGSATDVTKTGATLGATVDTAGRAATVTFEATAPGRAPVTRTTALAAATGARPVSLPVDDLPAGTDVTWRVRVSTDGGSADGEAKTFTTSAPAVRYAAPDGSGATCSQASPCTLPGAVAASAAGDTVVLASGTYGSSATPTGPNVLPDGLTLRGAVTGPGRPVVNTAGIRLNGAATARDLDVRHDAAGGTALLLQDHALADRVAVRGADSTCRLEDDSRMTNSLCVGPAIAVALDDRAAVRNVTADAAQYAFSGTGTVTSSIGRGTTAGARSAAGTLALDRSAVTGTEGAGVAVTNPRTPFPTLDPGYRAVAGASTIDAGDGGAVAAGELDLDGNVRVLGGGVDAGAFERVPQSPGAATGVATTRVTAADVAGTVGTGGGATSYRFEYGPTSAYGSSTPPVRVLGDAGGAVAATITGLPSNATFHYRLVATNDAGTTNGTDRTASTPGAAPAVSTGTAKDVTASTATLPVTVNTNGEAATVRAVITAPAGAAQTIEQEVAAASGDRTIDLAAAGLPTGTQITFKGEVQTRGATERLTATGSDATFDTLALPAATTGEATAITNTTATLAATVDTRGLAGTARFEITPEGGATTTVDRVLAAGAGDRPVSADVSGLPADTPVSWRVVLATTTATTDGDAKAFRTLPNPPAATSGDAGAVTTSGVTLTGTADTRGVAGAAWFEVTRDGTTTRTPDQVLAAATGARTVTAELTGLPEGVELTYRLVVRTAGGETRGDARTARTATTPPPPVVTPAPAPAPSATPTPVPTAAEPKPKLTLKLRKGLTSGQLLLSRRTITLFARCGGVACRATGTGFVRLAGRRIGRLGSAKTVRLAAGRRGRILLRSSARLRAQVRRRLAANPRARAEVVFCATFVGADGSRVGRRVTIKVRQLH